jgi:hypothetical protein
MKYLVTTAKNFYGPRRHRCGVEILRGQVLTLELNEEQVKAIEADDMLVLTKVEVPKAAAKKSAPKQMVDEAESKEA